MVSKVAVIALVLIVACPILLGYGMNLQEVTETDYKASGESTNYTPLLQNGSGYTYTHGEVYQMNTRAGWGSYADSNSLPIYNTISSVRSSFVLKEKFDVDWTDWNGTQSLNYPYIYEQFDYDFPTESLRGVIYGMVGGTEQVIHDITTGFHSIYYDKESGVYTYSRYSGNNFSTPYTNTGELTKVILYMTGTANVYTGYYVANNYVDFTDGYYFQGDYSTAVVKLPDRTTNVLITLNLDSITSSSYTNYLMTGNFYKLSKTTTDGVVSWTVQGNYAGASVLDLYYDPSRSDNTYQILYTLTTIDHSGGYYYYNDHTEFRYVGGWPNIIGEANSYYTVSDDVQTSQADSNPERSIKSIGFSQVTQNKRTPTMRIDDCLFRGFEYPIIESKTYDPAVFKTNPTTTISNVQIYGSSLTFGGNTYTVSKGNITLDGRQIPVNNLVLSSVPTDSGYENRIGNTTISTTADPSTITFNGKWSASISTDSMEQTTITKTKWIPGQFAWDGLGTNFLMVGLLTSLGAFIVLGIYIKRTRASLWPLLLVCGGAAVLFFIMI